MAILPVERSMCNKMVFDFNGLISPSQSIESIINGKANQMQGLLNGLISSPQSAIDAAISGLTGLVDDIIPTATLSDMRALQRFIEECEYLSGLSAIAAMLGALNSIYDKINGFFDNIGATLPEFDISKIASIINDLLGGRGMNISNLLKDLDKLLNCIALYCGGEYPDQLTNMSAALNQTYSNLNITSNPASSSYGDFDFNTLYDSAGLSLEQMGQVDQVTAAADGEKDRAESTIKDAIDIYKENLL